MNRFKKAPTILVADDCAPVCEVMEILLCRAGYDVLTATDGEDALELARASDGIDLLIANPNLPGLRGDELAAQVERLFPAIAVIFMSGSREPEEHAGSSHWLVKPFTVGDLRDCVGHALRSHEQTAGHPEMALSHG